MLQTTENGALSFMLKRMKKVKSLKTSKGLPNNINRCGKMKCMFNQDAHESYLANNTDITSFVF